MERRMIQCQSAPVRVEKRADGKEIVTGYGAVFYDGTRGTEYELWTGAHERILPGAFDRALKAGQDVRGLFNHDPSQLLGRTAADTMRLSVDKVGLRYEIDLPDTATGRDVRSLIARGDLSGSSFAFSVMTEEWRKQDGMEIREIKDVDLFDTGPVTFPAYSGTSVGVRATDTIDEARAAYDAWKSRAQRDQASSRARLAEMTSQ